MEKRRNRKLPGQIGREVPIELVIPLFFYKPVTNSRHCLDKLGTGWIRFNLAAQPVDHILEQGVIALPAVSPHPIDQLIRIDSLAGITHKDVHQAEFKVGQLQGRGLPIDQ